MNTECPNCQRLKAELQKAQAKIATLEAERRRGRRQAAPFSRNEPKPDPKPPDRRPGQGRFTYRQAPSEEQTQETVQIPLEACPECGGLLEDRATHEQVQVDLPQVKSVVVRLSRELSQVLREALALRDEQPVLEVATFRAGVEQLEAKLDVLLAEERRITDADNARFAKRLRKRWRHLLRFLQVERVAPCGSGEHLAALEAARARGSGLLGFGSDGFR